MAAFPAAPADSIVRALPAVQLVAVEKSYGAFRRKPALNGVTLSIARGECYGLAGSNGAGKTTLIKVMLGLVVPDAGEARLFGERPEHPGVRRRVGFVPEAAELPHGATPLDLVRRWARLRGLPKRAAMEDGEQQLVRLGMKDLLKRTAHRFSKGEKQRTLLALALLGGPDLLVLDEPTDGLDPLGRALMRRVIVEECAAGRTVFLNSHLLSETEQLCTRVGILHHGKLVREEVLSESGRRRTAIALHEALPPEGASGLGLLPSRAEGRYILEHENIESLNAAIDRLRQSGALITEIRSVGSNLEGVLTEVASGAAVSVAATESAVEEGPPLRTPPLRMPLAALRVAREIASDLWARRIFQVAMAGAIALLALLVFVAKSEIGVGLASAAAVANSGSEFTGLKLSQWLGGLLGQMSHMLLIIPAVFLAGFFAPPLLEPRRSILLHAQPVTRGDVATGVLASVLVMSCAVFFFFDLILFAAMRLFGAGVSNHFLGVPLATGLMFAAIYTATLGATYLVPNGLFAAFFGLGQLILFSVIEHLGGTPKAWGYRGWQFASGILPRMGELTFVSRDLGSGGSPHLFVLAATAIYACAVALIVQVIARRSER